MSPLAFHTLLTSLFSWIWNTSLAATILAGLILLICALLPYRIPPRWTYGLWALVLARLLLPSAPPARFSISNLYQKQLTPLSVASPDLPPPPDSTAHPINPRLQKGRTLAKGDLDPPPPPAKAKSQALALTHQTLPYCWFLGAAGFLLFVTVQHRRLITWARRQEASSDPEITTLVDQGRAALGLKRPVTVITTNSISTPAILGCLRPLLFLPKTLQKKLTSKELEMVVLHELIHLKRHDGLLNWILIGLQALHWFNPFIWSALKRLRAAREQACDAQVLALLSTAERHLYGTTLIKLLEIVPTHSPETGLVPILNRKNEIKKRITMITHFKPTRPIVSITSLILLTSLACLTFTSANPTETDSNQPKTTPANSRSQDYTKGIETLQKELDQVTARINQQEDQVNELRSELGISPLLATGISVDPETTRQVERMRIEAQAEEFQLSSLWQALSKLTRPELRNSISTVSPDPNLSSLFDNLAASEQKLATIAPSYAPEHPERRSLTQLTKRINQQIDERIDGILQGLKTKSDVAKAKLTSLTRQLEEMKQYEIRTSIQARPFYQATRDLESLLYIRERLKVRLLQAKIDQKLPPNFPSRPLTENPQP